MTLYIKYMVSLRCKIMVKEELKKLNIRYEFIDLGMVETEEDLTDEQWDSLNKCLLKWGLELLDDKKSILIEQIKVIITEMVHYAEELPITTFSVFLSEKLGYDYTYLANIFSEVKGVTIQHYIMMHKIERAKELLMYDELTLTEIAHKLHYSSVGHLSAQFKKITGLTPTYFKGLKRKRRIALDSL